ncbi:unnamed protein product [Adineta ricciae]|uniref:Paired domain-containing protein n=1 Tax=Adineta ricciae TaxID=249248 RepID=A0A815UAR2_ADIRI|nr:unnamed protein product [Adineta ricciae]
MEPKIKEHSTDVRSQVIQHYLNGDSYPDIVDKVLIPRPTIQSIVQKYKKSKCVLNLWAWSQTENDSCRRSNHPTENKGRPSKICNGGQN